MNQRKKKTYCQIIGCVNNKGTFDKNEVMFRIPSTRNRSKWIEQIKKHQTISPDKNLNYFNVCIRHFMESDYEKKKDQFRLNNNAVPSVFEDSSDFIEIICDEIIQETVLEATKCSQCPCLLDKIKDLERQILILKTKLSVTIGKMDEKNANLKEKITEKMKQLKISEKKTNKLESYLEDIRSQNFISDEERDFLNVIV